MFAASAVFPDETEMFWRGEFGGLQRLLADPTIDKVFHNAKNELRHFEAMGFQVRGKFWDTMIFGHLVNGQMAGKRLSLDNMSRKYLPPSEQKVVGELNQWFDDNHYGKDERFEKFIELPPDLLRRRNVGDSRLTMLLFKRLYTTVSNVFPLLLEQEHNLVPVVVRMENRGVLVDYDAIEQQQDEFTEVLEHVLRFCEGITDIEEFNINSHRHQEILLEKAGLLRFIPRRKSKLKVVSGQEVRVPGSYILDDWNLRQLHHPVSHMLLLGKACGKMRDTFLAQMQRLSLRGVLHPNFNQLGTTTGRFSCSKPNLQNIPIEGDRRTSYTADEAAEAEDMTGFQYAPHIKRIFKCRPGFAHIHSDKKQAEMYMLGHYANDQKMIQLFNECIDTGGSIHKLICRELYKEITKGLTTRTKAVVFGYIYGAGLEVLAKKIGGTVSDAQDTKTRLGHVFPGLPRLKRELDQQIMVRGYVETVHGRRHYLRSSESYVAVNRVCQGSVGDEIKSRMVEIDRWAQSSRNGAQLLLNIHDDLGTEVPIEEVPQAVPEVKRIMEETSVNYRLRLPSSLDVTYTKWSDLQEIEDVNKIPEPPRPAKVCVRRY